MTLSTVHRPGRWAAAVLCLALAACASAPPPAPTVPALTDASPQQMVAAIRDAAGDGEGELAVQPLRDGRIEDLRERAAREEAAGDYAAAITSLDAALAVVPDAPGLLQERAELALLQGDVAEAERLSQRAYVLGPQVGPACRRHWATLEQIRLLQGDAEGAAQARAQIGGCRVGVLDRF
ncbi:hypothetical protein E5843_12045 [Luteimonas yindakuii]|uniref:hypothetical protein n=1 Tax=Luteimonas yindakuii TaxID=2565782 RepID=UPI0010A54BA8|nr:hypothetical protein [Luteimonas yindakuii]QCO68311.1 hypothetical protein E5843_12045 [Luteimonas yindakuii]